MVTNSRHKRTLIHFTNNTNTHQHFWTPEAKYPKTRCHSRTSHLSAHHRPLNAAVICFSSQQACDICGAYVNIVLIICNWVTMNQERVASSSCPARPTHETPSVHLGNARAFCVRSVCFRRGVMLSILAVSPSWSNDVCLKKQRRRSGSSCE